MYDFTAIFKEKDIYSFLSEEQIQKAPVVNVAKNTTFISSVNRENVDLYYILEGVVEVVSHSYNGRSFLVDTVAQGDFIGKFSNMRKQNFYADIKTRTACKLLNLSRIKDEILKDEHFLLFFCVKTSNRLYEMYKISMMNKLFTYEEILAYYLLNIASEAGVVVDTDKNICFNTGISERQYYYIMKKLRDRGVVKQDKKNIHILDIASLEAAAFNIIRFMGNSI